MSEPPLWKRIGIHKLKYRTEAQKSTSERVVSQRGRSSNSHDAELSSRHLYGAQAGVCQSPRLLSPVGRLTQSQARVQNEEHCFKSLLDQFRQMDELEKSATSQFVSQVEPQVAQQEKRDLLTSPKESFIQAESRGASDSESNSPKQRKQPVVVLFLKQLRSEMLKIRDTVLREKANFIDDMHDLMSKTAAALSKQAETVQIQNKLPDSTHRCKQSRNFSMVLDTIIDDSRPREQTRQHTQSDQWIKSQAQLLQQQNQLRQTIEKLNSDIHSLHLELDSCKHRRESERLMLQESHNNFVQLLKDSHDSSLKEAREAYTKIICEREATIAVLKAETIQKSDYINKVQKRQRDSQLEIQSSINNVYVKKYKELYQKSETERVRLQGAVEDLNRELEVVNMELEDARKESNKVFDQKLEMLKRVEELSNDVKGKVHEVKKTLMLDFRERVEQLEQENASLRENLKERERVIDSMKGELDSFQISIRELREELRVKDALNSDDDQCEFLQPPPQLIRHAESQSRKSSMMKLPLDQAVSTQFSVKDQKIHKQAVSDRNLYNNYYGTYTKRDKKGSIDVYASPAKRPTKGIIYNDKSPYMLKTHMMGLNRNKQKLMEYSTRSDQKGFVTLQAKVELLRKMMQSDIQSSLRKAY